MSGSMSRKHSNIWLHCSPQSSGKARCDICKALLAYTVGTTSNLAKHLKARHPSVVDDVVQPKKQTIEKIQPRDSETSSGHENDVVSDGAVAASSAVTVTTSPQPAKDKPVTVGRSAVKQNTLGTYMVRPTSVSRQKRLNSLLLKMVVKDFQPFSVVTDSGFREFVGALDPSYSLPSRTTLTKELLPSAYSTAVDRVKARLNDAEAVTITTDGWTSLCTESYIAVTCHFITSDFKMDSYLLQCNKFTERHTAQNLSGDLLAALREWGLCDKVQAIVTDSAANISAAVRLTGYTHLFCFAHILNLVVQNGIKVLQPIQTKVKAIVEYFHRSTVGTEKLIALQRQLRPQQHNAVKLKNDVVTRWNSTYDMFRRICEIQEPVDAAIAVLQKPVEGLTSEEWSTLKEVCKVLKPFESVTKEMSSEDAVTVSKVIVLVEGLRSACQKLQPTFTMPLGQELADALLQELTKRFGNCDMNVTLARATFLDPRFKKLGFRSDTAFAKAKDKVITDVTKAISTKHATLTQQV